MTQEIMQHDRPCGECLNFRQGHDGSWCVTKLIAVTADMRVGYYADPPPGYPGLCFKEAVVKVRTIDMRQPCALTLIDLPSPCPRCQATDDGENGECPCDD